MDTTIDVQVKNIYGQHNAYPVNEQARRLAKIAGTKTLTAETLKKAQYMGFTVNIKAPNVNIDQLT